MGGEKGTRGARGYFGARRATAALAALALVGALALPGQARAAEHSLGENFGLGLVAGFGTFVYFPVKMVYSMVGGLVGGLTYLVTLADEETANAVWEPTLGGTYVLTPDMIAGNEPVSFIGSAPARSKASAGQWPE